ncbi:P-loop containing nucleoside triphosphate hydrolase protein [Nadsonia fulvescens var. elongata DSM 6958]|uniref:p-loop containing nucleoside triphosphate hydrolase protein n=1 Tax=Nadsonia fulvescens var. elongata DSM 6958 TaxID=857566 RepID=A0A1E3PLS7_9ASCO|nr:P-loop containing nucleoside triphosphate hydrolase protein [Nadsonia fulvescens var. elongata DSM 6958]
MSTNPTGFPRTLIVLIGGGHAAGKKVVCDAIENRVRQLQGPLSPLIINTIHMEDYLKSSESSGSTSLDINTNNHRSGRLVPSRFDFDRLINDIESLSLCSLNSRPVRKTSITDIPTPFQRCNEQYQIPTTIQEQQRANAKLLLSSPLKSNALGYSESRPHMILVEGLYALHDVRLRAMSSMMIFVDSDPDTRLARWILRDVGSGKKTLDVILDEYLNECRPEMAEFIFPTKEFSDVILPHGSETTGIEIVGNGIHDILRDELKLFSSSMQNSQLTPTFKGAQHSNATPNSISLASSSTTTTLYNLDNGQLPTSISSLSLNSPLGSSTPLSPSATPNGSMRLKHPSHFSLRNEQIFNQNERYYDLE